MDYNKMLEFGCSVLLETCWSWGVLASEYLLLEEKQIWIWMQGNDRKTITIKTNEKLLFVWGCIS